MPSRPRHRLWICRWQEQGPSCGGVGAAGRGGCPLHPQLLLRQELDRTATSLHLFNMMIFAKRKKQKPNRLLLCRKTKCVVRRRSPVYITPPRVPARPAR